MAVDAIFTHQPAPDFRCPEQLAQGHHDDLFIQELRLNPSAEPGTALHDFAACMTLPPRRLEAVKLAVRQKQRPATNVGSVARVTLSC